MFAKVVSDLCTTSEIQLDPGLKAGSIGGHELFHMANNIRAQHLLVSAHADLVRALPAQTAMISEAVKNGWFTNRPVLILVKYDIRESRDSAHVLACEDLLDGKWRNLLQQ